MEDYPEQFFLVCSILGLGIVLYPIYANIDFRFDGGAGSRKAKCDDVGIVVMLQEVPVDLQEIVIRTKYIVDEGKPLPLPFEDAFYERLQFCSSL